MVVGRVGVVVAVGVRVVVMMMMMGVRIWGPVDVVVVVVAGALCGVSEDLVGGGYGCEFAGGFWVFLVSVWVVAEGEGVEFPGWLGVVVSR